MSREKDSCILMAVLFPVLPWMLTVVLLGRTACPLSKKPDIEAYTASVAASQISWAYEQEAIRAQVVLARTKPVCQSRQAGRNDTGSCQVYKKATNGQ